MSAYSRSHALITPLLLLLFAVNPAYLAGLSELTDVVPYECPREPLSVLDISECIYNISINLVASNVTHVHPEHTKIYVQEIGSSASDILHTAHDFAEEFIDNQPYRVVSQRAPVNFDDQDQIERNHFMHIHFPNEAFDSDGLINQFSESKIEVKNLAKLSTKAYRTMELLLDSVGEADKELGRNKSEYFFDGTTLVSDSLETSDISEHSDIVLQAHHSVEDKSHRPQEPVKVHISSEIKSVFDSMGVSNVQIQMLETLDNPFFDDNSAVIKTPIVSVVMKDYTPGREHEQIVLEGVAKPFEFWMPLSPKDDGDEVGTTRIQRRAPLSNLSNEDIQPYHLVLPYDALVIVEIVNASKTAEYAVVHLKDYWPVKNDFCGGSEVAYLKFDPKNDSSLQAKFATEKSNFSRSHLDGEQYLDYYIAIYMADSASKDPMVQFTFKITRLSCLFRDEDMEFWSERGCVVSEESNSSMLHCKCNHASIFAGTQFTVPNDIETVNVFDFKASDFHDNPIILGVVCSLVALYIVGMIISFWLDVRNKRGNVGITIMTDIGGPVENFYYLITVITGNRLYAGTSANVSLQLYGVQGRSQVYTLRESRTPVLKRGGIDSFLVSSDKYLGKIEKIRIWHDNSGKSPDWYCRKVIIKEIKRDIEFLFFIEDWLRVTGKKSTIIYENRLATDKELRSFRRRFHKNLVEDLDNSHLWLSFFRHPTASRFTRCQRLSCAFSILALYMLSNILMYGVELEDPDDPYGLQSYIVALQMALLELPFGFAIIYMFWLIRERHIPTLIVWRKHADTIKSRPRGSVFVPRKSRHSQSLPPPPSPPPVEDGAGETTSLDLHSSPSQTSENCSIKSTNVEDFEKWVSAYQGGDHRTMVHAMMDEDDSSEQLPASDRVGWGRRGLVGAFRALNLGSFFYKGEHDPSDVETLIDEELKETLIEVEEKKRQKSLAAGAGDGVIQVGMVGQGQGQSHGKGQGHVPDHVSAKDKHRPSTPEDEEDVGIAFETCKMKPYKKGGCYLPWWFIFISWTICLASIFIFLYFTLLYGLHYGYLRSLDYLYRVAMSFLLSVFIIQPLNIVLWALIFTILCPPKYWSVMDEERFQIIDKKDGADDLGQRDPIMLKVFEAEREHPPLKDDTIFELKIAARRWERVKSAVGKLIFYILLLVPLILFSYSGRSSHDYRLVRNMRNMLHTQGPYVNTPEELYGYLTNIVTPMVHATKKYDGNPVSWRRLGAIELQDRINILIGVPRVRQVRAPKEKCNVPDSVKSTYENCYFSYDISNQETGTYYPFWMPVKDLSERKFSASNDVWKFRGRSGTHNLTGKSQQDIDAEKFVRSRNIRGEKATYDGGGYVAELGRVSRQTISTLKYLQRNRWIDHQTRAVFVEFTTYNPNLHLFVDIVVMIERGPSRSFFTSFEITPLRLRTDDDIEGPSVAMIAFFLLAIGAVILLLNLVWIIIFSTELRLYKRHWFWLDIVMILGIVVSLSVSLKKYYVMEDTTRTIQTMKINEYVSLQELAFWDGIQTAAFSITQFICFLKIWQLLVFLDGGFLVTTLTVGLASRAIFAYFCISFVVIMGFSCAGHVFFGSSMSQFRTLWDSWVTLVGQSLQVKIFAKLYSHDRIIGPIFGSLFGFVVAFLFLNILISILNQARKNAKLMAREKFLNWGIGESVVHHFCAKRRPKKLHPSSKPDVAISISDEESLELEPARVDAMKEATIQFLRTALQSENATKMRAMKSYANTFLAEKGYHVVPKRSLADRQDIETEEKMNRMRAIVAEFLRSQIGVDMSIEELRKYNDVNKAVVSLRIFKLEKLVGELQARLKVYEEV